MIEERALPGAMARSGAGANGPPIGSTLAVGLVSAVLIALQVLLMHGLAFAQGQSLAWMIISIALLGFGGSGSTLYLVRRKLGAGVDRFLVPSLVACALSCAWVLLPLNQALQGLLMDTLLFDSGQWVRLLSVGAVLVPPLFFGATAIALVLASASRQSGVYYASNLAGSSLGALLALILLRYSLPEDVIPHLGWLALTAALAAHLERGRGGGWKRGGGWVVVSLAVLAGSWFSRGFPVSDFKALSQAMRLPGVVLECARPSMQGRVQVLRSDFLRYAPDLSLLYQGPVPSPATVFVNGFPYARVMPMEDPGNRILERTPRALPFVPEIEGSTLLLQPGGTPLIAMSLGRGGTVTAVEPHPQVEHAIRHMVNDHRFSSEVSAPRSFLERARAPRGGSPSGRYARILFPERGSFGGVTGLMAMAEDPLFTVGGIESALSLLMPDGFLGFSVWLDEPPRQTYRLFDTIGQALRSLGMEDPARCVLAVGGWGSISLLVGRTPLSSEVVDAVAVWANGEGFDLLWPKDRRVGGPWHEGEGRALEGAWDSLLGAQRGPFLSGYRFAVSAPTDDRPFFDQFLRLPDILKLILPGAADDLSFLAMSEVGAVVVWIGLLILAGAGLVLVLGPVLVAGGPPQMARFTLLYFGGLGAGFMLFQISFIQRMTLVWSAPAQSAAVVMATVLLGMGLGSWFSRAWPVTARRLALVGLVLVLLQIALLATSGTLLRWLLGFPEPLVWVGGLCLLLPPSVLLGLPFALGLRWLGERSEEEVPWAWAINGCFSVAAPPLAALLALSAGYAVVGWVAAGAYLCAAIGAACAPSVRGDLPIRGSRSARATASGLTFGDD